MKIVVNGKETHIAEGATILTMLEKSAISPDSVVVEHNKDIVPSDQFEHTVLHEGDSLEVLRFVGGG